MGSSPPLDERSQWLGLKPQCCGFVLVSAGSRVRKVASKSSMLRDPRSEQIRSEYVWNEDYSACERITRATQQRTGTHPPDEKQNSQFVRLIRLRGPPEPREMLQGSQGEMTNHNRT